MSLVDGCEGRGDEGAGFVVEQGPIEIEEDGFDFLHEEKI